MLVKVREKADPDLLFHSSNLICVAEKPNPAKEARA
jgi:hypothetical protein